MSRWLRLCGGGLARGLLTLERAVDAVDDYLDVPLTRHGHAALIGRVLEIRDISAYDAPTSLSRSGSAVLS